MNIFEKKISILNEAKEFKSQNFLKLRSLKKCSAQVNRNALLSTLIHTCIMINLNFKTRKAILNGETNIFHVHISKWIWSISSFSNLCLKSVSIRNKSLYVELFGLDKFAFFEGKVSLKESWQVAISNLCHIYICLSLLGNL